MGAFLSGRVTYELMAGFWPTADSDPSSTGPVADFARIWRDMTKIVYSRTLKRADWNTTVVREVVPADVRALKDQPGGDLTLGGAGSWRPSGSTTLSTSSGSTSTPSSSAAAKLFRRRTPVRHPRLVETRRSATGSCFSATNADPEVRTLTPMYAPHPDFGTGRRAVGPGRRSAPGVAGVTSQVTLSPCC